MQHEKPNTVAQRAIDYIWFNSSSAYEQLFVGTLDDGTWSRKSEDKTGGKKYTYTHSYTEGLITYTATITVYGNRVKDHVQGDEGKYHVGAVFVSFKFNG